MFKYISRNQFLFFARNDAFFHSFVRDRWLKVKPIYHKALCRDEFLQKTLLHNDINSFKLMILYVKMQYYFDK